MDLQIPLLLFVAFLITSSQAKPKWIWVPDDLFDRTFANITDSLLSPQKRSEVPHHIQRTYNYHEHHLNSGQVGHVVHGPDGSLGGGGPGEGGEVGGNEEELEDSNTGPRYESKGQPYADYTKCHSSDPQKNFVESNAVCKSTWGQEYKYYDYRYDAYNVKRKIYICCKPKPGCAFTGCYRDKYTGVQACQDSLGSEYKFTGSYTTATCETRVFGPNDFYATCCKKTKLKSILIG